MSDWQLDKSKLDQWIMRGEQADSDDIDDQLHETRVDADGWPTETWCEQCGRYHPVMTRQDNLDILNALAREERHE